MGVDVGGSWSTPFQLDLFDTVMNEDRKDAFATGMADEGGDGGGVSTPDHAAVVSMRSVMGTLQNEEMRSVVETIAANMEKMVIAGCNAKALQHWREIRYRPVMVCSPQVVC